jgi:hypothetical protein
MKQTPTSCSSCAGGPGSRLWNPLAPPMFRDAAVSTDMSHLQCGRPRLSLCGGNGRQHHHLHTGRQVVIRCWRCLLGALSSPYWFPILGMTRLPGAEPPWPPVRLGCAWDARRRDVGAVRPKGARDSTSGMGSWCPVQMTDPGESCPPTLR